MRSCFISFCEILEIIILFIFFLINSKIVYSIGISPSKLDFGLLYYGQSKDRYVTLFNTENRTIRYFITVDERFKEYFITPLSITVGPLDRVDIKIKLSIPKESEIKLGNYDTMIIINEEMNNNSRFGILTNVRLKIHFSVVESINMDNEKLNEDEPFDEYLFLNSENIDTDINNLNINNITNLSQNYYQKILNKLNGLPILKSFKLSSIISMNGIIISFSIVLIGLLIYNIKK